MARIGKALREVGFIVVCLFMGYLLVALWTHTDADPSYSVAVASDGILNLGGVFGAYASSLLFELFGYSAYLLCLIGVVFGAAALLRAPGEETHRLAWWAAGLGVALFMASSSALEFLRFHYPLGLSAGSGGLVGHVIAPVIVQWFGLLGASVALMAIWLLSWSLAAGLSWFAFLEVVGAGVETLLLFMIGRGGRRRAKQNDKRLRASAENAVREAVSRRAAAAPARREPAIKLKPGGKSGAAPAAVLPDVSLLQKPPPDAKVDQAVLTETSRRIEGGLEDFGIKASVAAVHPGPVITRYDILPATGVKGSQIVNLSRDLARSLSVASIRVLENIPGASAIGLEIPNKSRQPVMLSEMITSRAFTASEAALPLALGKTASGEPAITDLAGMPHLLVAGSTGAGKSVFVNAILLSLLYSRSPSELRLLLIDPKMLELAVYADIPHLLAPVVTDMAIAPAALNWAVEEMESRYKSMAAAGVRHISSFNVAARAGELKDDSGEALQPMPYIAVIIDELADLMMVAGKKVEISISRLAQKARAAGIHIVLATQRPSVDVITGLIKANIPCRLSFQVASKIDSRTILDQMGAETLLGKGDMLFLPSGSGVPQRLHGAFVSDDEVKRVTDFVRDSGQSEYLTDDFSVAAGADGGGGGGAGFAGGGGEGGGNGEGDALYDQAVEAVMSSKRVSISLVQRKLRIGYNRAARLVEAMEEAGLVSPMNEFGARKIIAPNNE